MLPQHMVFSTAVYRFIMLGDRGVCAGSPALFPVPSTLRPWFVAPWFTFVRGTLGRRQHDSRSVFKDFQVPEARLTGGDRRPRDGIDGSAGADASKGHGNVYQVSSRYLLLRSFC